MYTWIACQFTTGEVITEVPLTGWTAARHLTGGQLTGQLVLSQFDAARRRELLDATEPGRCSLVLDRDGRVMGEWLLWAGQGATADGPLPIGGKEVVSYLQQREIPANDFGDPDDPNDPGVEQLDIAAWMARQAFGGQGGRGAVAIDIPDPAPSGRQRRRSYKVAEASIGQRLQELSQVIDGFEYAIDTAWADSKDRQRVARTFRLAYPQAGSDAGLVFDDQGGSIVDLSYSRDGSRLGSRAFALCSGDDNGQIVGIASSTVLLDAGYPALDVTHSWTSVNQQETALAHAQELLAVSQSPEVPPKVTVLAGGDPALGDYGLGDIVRLTVGERTNLPDGYDRKVRILGWTITEPGSAAETVDLQVTSLGVTL